MNYSSMLLHKTTQGGNIRAIIQLMQYRNDKLSNKN
jgi:hypothetical protein